MAYSVYDAPLKLLSEMLPKIHTMEKCYFLKPIIQSPIISFSVLTLSDTYNEFLHVHESTPYRACETLAEADVKNFLMKSFKC